MSLKAQRAWGINHLSRKPALRFDHSLCIEVFPNVKSEFPVAQLWTTPTCLQLDTREKRPAPSSPFLPRSGNCREQSPFPQSKQNQIPSPLPTGYAFQLFHWLTVYYLLCFKITSWSSQGKGLSYSDVLWCNLTSSPTCSLWCHNIGRI